MGKMSIRILKTMDGRQEIEEKIAIKNEEVIKYIDSDNNIMVVDMNNNIIKRENHDYYFNIDLAKERIEIRIKKLNKVFIKEIKTILLKKKKNAYLVRYQLIDENIINEYCIKF